MAKFADAESARAAGRLPKRQTRKRAAKTDQEWSGEIPATPPPPFEEDDWGEQSSTEQETDAMADRGFKALRKKMQEKTDNTGNGGDWDKSAQSASERDQREAMARAGQAGQAIRDRAQDDVRESDGQQMTSMEQIVRAIAAEVQAQNNQAQAHATAAVDEEAVKKIAKQVFDEHTPKPKKFTFTTNEGTKSGTMDLAHKQMPYLAGALAAGVHAFLPGPTGSGKTHAVEQLARSMGREFFALPPISDAFQAIGYKDANGLFHETAFTMWAKSKGAILLFDEVDGSDNAAVLALNMALSNGYVALPTGELRAIDSTNLIVCTANTWGTGATAEYVGRNRLDDAFVARFPARIHWDYDLELELEIGKKRFGDDAANEILWMQRVRDRIQKESIKVVCSPRDTFAYCAFVRAGLSHARAMEIGPMASLDNKQREKILAKAGRKP